MQRTGVASLPLHPGKAPPWLFKRMVALAREITTIMVHEYGTDEFVKRLADPYWFQSLSCVLGFDWHSSGTTTVTCGALREAILPDEHGIAMVGGKGAASTKAPDQIVRMGDAFSLPTKRLDEMVYGSRMVAKVDTAAIQTGHHIYHHSFIFTEKGTWTVVQQGLAGGEGTARRYHWLSNTISSYVGEPHDTIVGESRVEHALDMTARDSIESRKASVDIINDGESKLRTAFAALQPVYQQTLDAWADGDGATLPKPTKEQAKIAYLHMPKRIDWDAVRALYDFKPTNYEDIIAAKGIGPATVRALALISDLMYGTSPSWNDPIKYSFTVGGKDGVPYPVNRPAMDASTELLKHCIEDARIGNEEKIKALRRLRRIVPDSARD